MIVAATVAGPPKEAATILVIAGKRPERPHRILGEFLYEDGLSTFHSGPIPDGGAYERFQKEAAAIGADGVLDFECGASVIGGPDFYQSGFRCRAKPFVWQ